MRRTLAKEIEIVPRKLAKAGESRGKGNFCHCRVSRGISELFSGNFKSTCFAIRIGTQAHHTAECVSKRSLADIGDFTQFCLCNRLINLVGQVFQRQSNDARMGYDSPFGLAVHFFIHKQFSKLLDQVIVK